MVGGAGEPRSCRLQLAAELSNFQGEMAQALLQSNCHKNTVHVVYLAVAFI